MQNLKNIIKKPIKMSLKENLNYMTVAYLKELAEKYEINKVYKMKKQELVDVLTERILDENYLISNIAAFEERMDYDKILFGSEDNDSIIAFMYSQIGVSFIYDLGNGNAKSIIPDDLVEIINKIDLNKVNLVKARYSLIFNYIRAFNNLYGVYESKVLINTFNSQNSGNNIQAITEEELQYCLYKYNIFNESVAFDGTYIICGALCMNEDDYKEVVENQQDKDYYIPSREELLKYSNEYYVEKTKYYDDLHTYLMKIINNKRNVDGIILDIHSACVMGILNIDTLIARFEIYGISFANVNESKRLLDLCMNFSMHTHKWSNRGWTSYDLNKHNNNVISIKVGRNDPCPCGSGKKYKKCCGR